MRLSHYALVVLTAALVACQSPTSTRVHVEVTADPAWNLDGYQLRIGDKAALVDPLLSLDLELPDAMAGTEQTLSLWGLVAGEQVAYGTTIVTPMLDGKVDAAVTLAMVECGTWCTLGSISCSDNGTITCEEQSDGCVGWSAVSACPADAPFCSNGECNAQCTDECEASQTICDSSAAVRACGEFDQDSCADWSPPSACASGSTCTNGTCGEPIACANNGDDCDDGDPCTVADECTSGTCSGVAKCDPPANAVATCSSNGTCGFTCDPGFARAGESCAPQPKLVFMTAGNYLGNLGGLAGADAICQSEAMAAGRPGVFKAWLSSNTVSAASRLTHWTGQYQLVTGTRVANSWAHLVATPGVVNRISLDPYGESVGLFDTFLAWTNTTYDGNIKYTNASCINWTSSSGAVSGHYGTTESAGGNWTDSAMTRVCSNDLKLYCFEQ